MKGGDTAEIVSYATNNCFLFLPLRLFILFYNVTVQTIRANYSAALEIEPFTYTACEKEAIAMNYWTTTADLSLCN